MAEIREQSGISSSQASQFFPKERYYIPKSTVQRTKSVITSLNSGIVTDTFKNTASTPYDFVLTANNMSVFDLSQFYFNIAGTLKFPATAGFIHSEDLIFGNLFITSLFQNATLEIGGAVVALNTNPGIDANAQALLKFDQYDLKNYALSDREFMLNQINNDMEILPENRQWKAGFWVVEVTETTQNIHGKTAEAHQEFAKKSYYYVGEPVALIADDENTKVNAFTLTFDDQGNGILQAFKTPETKITTEKAATGINEHALDYTVWSTDDVIDSINRNSVIPTSNTTGFISKEGYISIPFRCKLYLSDLFNYTVDSLDYIFNRDVKITLTRSSNSNVICNLSHIGSNRSTVCDVSATTKFELVAYSYLLTDTARNELLKFYSRPIETLYGVQTVNLTPLYNDSPNAEQGITLPLTVNYDTKAIILAFPKCSNCLVPLSTNRRQLINGPIPADANGSFQYSWLFSNCNSYNYAGLKYIRISNTNNQSIATYDFSGTSEQVANVDQLLKSFDFTNKAINLPGTFNDYREIYEQMKQLRLLFGKSPDNAIDYYNFIKDYFIIPIDLTGTNIPPQTRIFVHFQFDNFADKLYHPLYFGNNKANEKLTTNLLAIYFGRDVLTYNPDGTCTVKHILSANPTEKKANLI
jgi:hypothetical protein